MIHEVKARYSNGAIVPLEPLDIEIEEGAALSISIAVELPLSPAPLATNLHAADTDKAADGGSLNQTLDALYIEDYLERPVNRVCLGLRNHQHRKRLPVQQRLGHRRLGEAQH